MALCCVLIGSLAFSAAADARWPFNKKKRERERQEMLAKRVAFSDSGEWQGYFKDEDGNPFSMQFPVEKNSHEDWMTLEFTEFNGNRTRIAVWKVVDEVAPQATSDTVEYGHLRFRTQASTTPLQAIEEMVTSSLFNANRFDVIERKQLEAILAEQDFGASDRVTDESAARIGRLLGAEFMFFTSINEWTPKKRSRGSIGIGRSVAEVAVSVRVVDTDTAKVTFAETFRGQATNRSVRVPFFGQRDVSPVNYAMASCLNQAIYAFATSIKVKAWKGAVSDVEGDMVTLNGGENRGVEKGQIYRALRKGKELFDPTDGSSLGFKQEVIGTLRVTSVDEKFSTGVIVEGCEGLKTGDFVEEVLSDSTE